jgi:hypothetical protein
LSTEIHFGLFERHPVFGSVAPLMLRSHSVCPRSNRHRTHRTRFASSSAEERSFTTASDGAVGADPEPKVKMKFSGPAIRALILIIVGCLGDPQQHSGLTREA